MTATNTKQSALTDAETPRDTFKMTVDLSGKLIPDTDEEKHARAKAAMARQ